MCSDACIRFSLTLLVFSLAVTVGWTQSGESRAFSATSTELIGLWAGEGEVIEFRSDGKCRYEGEIYDYELSLGHLLIRTAFGKVAFAYSIRQGKLILTADGVQSSYTRMTSADQVVPVHKDVRYPKDLIGRWCYLKSTTGAYSGRCITLNADGTYMYQEETSRSVETDELAGGSTSSSSDSGTYTSVDRGSGSFKLERRNHPVNKNDPMIVLDNEPFVTTERRPPWR
jgi:hypothetical protein